MAMIKAKKQAQFLDLKECVFRQIFKSLEEYEVYFVLIRVCHQIKSYVDDYIKLLGAFLLYEGGNWRWRQSYKMGIDKERSYGKVMFIFRKTLQD